MKNIWRTDCETYKDACEELECGVTKGVKVGCMKLSQSTAMRRMRVDNARACEDRRKPLIW